MAKLQFCEICQTDITAKNWKTHLQTSKHISNSNSGQPAFAQPFKVNAQPVGTTRPSSQLSDSETLPPPTKARKSRAPFPVPQITSTPIEEILSLIKSDFETNSNQLLCNQIYGVQWESLDSLCEETKTLWAISQVALPVLVPANECWMPDTPSQEDLTANVQKRSNKRSQKHVDRTELAMAISQINSPSKSSPISSTFHEIEIPGDAKLALPMSMESRYTVCSMESSMNFNITPRYLFVDIHLDTSYTVIASPIKDCKKVWLLWSPTEHNLRLYLESWGRDQRLGYLLQSDRDGPRLEGGIIVVTDHSKALILPSGTLHSTLTTSGGLLAGSMIYVAQSILGSALSVRQEIQCQLKTSSALEIHPEPEKAYKSAILEELSAITGNFLDFLEKSLEESPICNRWDCIKAWICLEPFLRAWIGQELKARVWKIWYREYGWLACYECAVCSCSRRVEAAFLDHFKEDHLQWCEERENASLV